MAEWQSKGAIGANLMAAATTPEFDLGTIVTAEDKSDAQLGEAEFMYVQADEAIDAYEAVTIDQADWNANLAVANAVGPIGVAVVNLADTEYGWVQISGKARVLVATGFAAGNPVYVTATPGTVDDAVVAGDMIYGSRSLSAIGTPAAGQAYIGLNRSFVMNT